MLQKASESGGSASFAGDAAGLALLAERGESGAWAGAEGEEEAPLQA